MFSKKICCPLNCIKLGRERERARARKRGGIGRVGGRRKREEIWGYMYTYR